MAFCAALGLASGCGSYARIHDNVKGGDGREDGRAGKAWLSPPAHLPTAIDVPPGSTLKIHDRGVGAQVYRCTTGGTTGASTYAWVLEAPDAVLYDATSTAVGRHGAGPTWTANDGSTIAGTKLAQADSPAPDAIPWLLLKTSPRAAAGVFSDIVYVQRLNTAGGKAPSTRCDMANVGSEARVNYSADYYFFTTTAVRTNP